MKPHAGKTHIRRGMALLHAALCLCVILAGGRAHAIRLEPEQVEQVPDTPPAAQYDASGFPDPVDVQVITYDIRWECMLWKNDGARDDGFKGEGGSEVQARTQAAHECSRTNHPHCYSMAMDTGHTACEQAPRKNSRTVEYAREDIPQQARFDGWECELWKNDGARKDGFTGTGPTIDDARDQAIAGCERTNNDYCTLYGQDDEHTACRPLLVFEKPAAIDSPGAQ